MGEHSGGNAATPASSSTTPLKPEASSNTSPLAVASEHSGGHAATGGSVVRGGSTLGSAVAPMNWTTPSNELAPPSAAGSLFSRSGPEKEQLQLRRQEKREHLDGARTKI